MQNALPLIRCKVWFTIICKYTLGIKENEKSEEQTGKYCKKSEKAIITNLG